jgi:hypothetical protein
MEKSTLVSLDSRWTQNPVGYTVHSIIHNNSGLRDHHPTSEVEIDRGNKGYGQSRVIGRN